MYMSNKTSDKNVCSIEEDIRILQEKDCMWHYPETRIEEAIENIIADYTRQKQINEEHQKINGELREKVKELEEENAMLRKSNNIAENVNIDDITKVINKSYEEFMSNYIPKQVVIDKIGKIINETTPTPTFKPQSKWNIWDYERLYKTQPLLELLKGENK